MAEARQMTETAEFKAAVQAAVAAALPDILAQIKASGSAAAEGSDEGFARGLAMAIAQLSDQGTGRKRVAPEVIAARDAARKRMVTLIAEARARGEVPRYHLVNMVYLDEMKVQPVWIDPITKRQKPTEIEWPGVPNEAMRPINEVAKAIFAAFKESIGSTAPEDLVADLPKSMTANGLVVKTGGASVRPIAVNVDGESQKPHGQGLRLPQRHEGNASFEDIRVLGTVAPPARVGATGV